jgi:hypothetical protein
MTALLLTNFMWRAWLGGQLVQFALTAKGLCMCAGPRQEDSTGWAFINLLDDRKQEFTRWQY